MMFSKYSLAILPLSFKSSFICVNHVSFSIPTLFFCGSLNACSADVSSGNLHKWLVISFLSFLAFHAMVFLARLQQSLLVILFGYINLIALLRGQR